VTPPEQDDRKQRLMVGGAALALSAMLVGVLLMPAGDARVDGDPAARADATGPASPGEVVAEQATGEDADHGTPVAAVGAAADPAEEPDDEADAEPYSSDAVVVDSDAGVDTEAVKAVKALTHTTDEVHACEARWQEQHEELGGTGRADPLRCVHEHTASRGERGSVRFDLVTKDGYSYYVDVHGQRYRYSEYDRAGCRSIDGRAGCGAW
jgi:hypothetical protein